MGDSPPRGRSNLYPTLPVSPIYNAKENSLSPLRNRLDLGNYSDEETEFRNRAGSYTKNPRLRMSPSPVPESVQKIGTNATPHSLIGSSLWLFVLVLAVLLAVVGFSLNPTKPSNGSLKSANDCSLFDQLQNSFPHQDQKLFKSLKVGAESFSHGELMVVTLFSTDMEIINSIMQGVIKATQKCINQSEDPINLNSIQLNTKMVADYKEELTRRSIMVINNVEEAQASKVSSLHAFCDTYNPLVSRSIIFITVKVPSKPPGKPVEYITNFLNQRWKTLPDHVRNPLITRMLDQTFFLKP